MLMMAGIKLSLTNMLTLLRHTVLRPIWMDLMMVLPMGMLGMK